MAKLRFISNIYPAMFSDDVAVSCGFVSCLFSAWPSETLGVTHAFLDGTVNDVQVTLPTQPNTDIIGVSHEFIGGVITVVQITMPTQPNTDLLGVTHEFVGGTLTVVQVNYNLWDVESLDVSGSFVSGVFT
jgi:hypothetical protein